MLTQIAPELARSPAKTMAAAVLVRPGRFETHDVPVPDVSPNQLLVQIKGCGVCASNIPPFLGQPWFTYPMEPGALGHEAWGTIVKVGHSVRNFALGDHVAMLSTHGFAEFDVTERNAAIKLPDSLKNSPFPAEPLGCALNIFRRSGIEAGDNVAIVGIGFLGALLTQLTTLAGARVIAISRRQYALRVARTLGAAHLIQLSEHLPVVEEVKRFTGGELCDVTIEAAGKQSPLDLTAELTRERGRLVIAGYHQDGPRQVNMQLWNWRGLDVINAHERDPQIYLDGMRAAARAVESGVLTPGLLYTNRFSLEQLGDGLETAIARPDGFMKALVLIS